MTEDELLDVLGEGARQQLSAQTRGYGPASIPEWSPLSDDEHQDIIGGALARLASEDDSDDSEVGPDSDPAQPVISPPIEPAANEAPRRAAWVVVAGVVAVAAAVLLWRGISPSSGSPLPSYTEAEFEAGTARVRGDTATEVVPRLPPSAELRWVLRPSTAIEGTVGLRILAQGAGRHCIAPTRGIRIASSGAIEVQGSVDRLLPLAVGPWTLTAIVGRETVLESMDDPCAGFGAGQGAPRGVVAAATRRVELIAEP